MSRFYLKIDRGNFVFPFLLLVAVCLNSCAQRTKGITESEVGVWNVKVRSTEEFIFSDFFKYSHFVVLETNEDSFINTIDKIQFDGDYIYILCKLQNKVLVFDKNGKFVRSLDKHGRGPDEYLSAVDMEVWNDNVYILDYHSSSVLKYDADGNLISSVKVTPADSFKLLDDNVFALNILHGGSSPDMERLMYNYALCRDGEVVNKDMPYSPVLIGRKVMMGEGRSAFYEYGDSVFALFPMKDAVYTVSKKDGRLEPYIVYDFPSKKPGLNDSEEAIFKYYWQDRKEKGVISDLFNFIKFGNYHFISYADGEQYRNLISHGDELLFNGRFKVDENGLPILPVSYLDNDNLLGGQLVSMINPVVLSAISGKAPAGVNINELLEDELLSIVSDDDNPVLFFYDWCFPIDSVFTE